MFINAILLSSLLFTGFVHLLEVFNLTISD